MVELAIETHIAPRVWAAEDDATIATAVTILNDRAEAIRRARR